MSDIESPTEEQIRASASNGLRPLRVGLTGGIASGKTTVSNLFAELGVPIIDSDQIARDVVEPGTDALAKIVATFGTEALDSTGRMDRAQMRERIFSDPAARATLEAIVHPAIREATAKAIANVRAPYLILVVPLLVEKNGAATFDFVLVVDCSEDQQLERLQARDANTLVQARRILASQASRAQRLSVANDVIVNAGSVDELRTRVAELHAKYLAAAQTRSKPA
jgi:dephospho-CoA kinase